MKKLLIVTCSIPALVLLSSISASADDHVEPVRFNNMGTIIAVPFEVTDPAEIYSSETPLFVDSVSDDIAYSVCCAGGLASCATGCYGNVRSFTCERIGARGCRANCVCL